MAKTTKLVATATALVLLAACGASNGDDDATVADGGRSGPTAEEPADSYDGDDSGDSGDSAEAGELSTQAYSRNAAADQAAPAPVTPTPVAEDGQSTFGLDVDSGSYTRARSDLEQGYLPFADGIRAEEFVNFFDMDYPDPDDGATFAITVDGGPTGDGRTMMRVGLQARRPDVDARKRAVLTFVIDNSGSMAEPGKMEVVKESLGELVDALNPDDQVAIVVYSDNSREVLPATKVEDRDTILNAIASLTTEGSTNAQAGLILGYETARKSFVDGATNRVILASDGLANIGDTSPEAILEDVAESAGDGIQLLTLGFGYGAYNDPLMEQLADKGDGFYAFVDGPREAQRLFRENLTSTLETVALDAKVQVTFDPATVTSYRLVGYDNRAIADDQFLDDSVDAGEVGSGHSVTALYELELVEGASADAALGTVALRWKEPGSQAAVQLDKDMLRSDVAGSYEDADARFRLAVTAARFAEALRAPERAELEDVARQAEAVAASLDGDTPERAGGVRELADLVNRAVALAP